MAFITALQESRRTNPISWLKANLEGFRDHGDRYAASRYRSEYGDLLDGAWCAPAPLPFPEPDESYRV
jgi:hypothetical protein